MEVMCMYAFLVSLFFENTFVCHDMASAQSAAQAWQTSDDAISDFVEQSTDCGLVTGSVNYVADTPYRYVRPSGLVVRLVEVEYRGVHLYYFRFEYRV